MSATTTPRRRWTDVSIESELREQIAELGHFPTRSELVSRGLRGLWDAMRSSGGVDSWRDRLESGSSASEPASVQAPAPAPAPASASHDEIAVRAYYLYEDGLPGDPMDHWLAAERELVGREQ
jgi:Arc/MetJ-type ribon-helix-helix transcriptional regulator